MPEVTLIRSMKVDGEAGAGDGAILVNDRVKGAVLEKVGGVSKRSRSGAFVNFFEGGHNKSRIKVNRGRAFAGRGCREMGKWWRRRIGGRIETLDNGKISISHRCRSAGGGDAGTGSLEVVLVSSKLGGERGIRVGKGSRS